MEIVKLIVTALLSAAALFVIARLMGHKQMAQLDFFDYISGITIGSIAAEMATELEQPWKPLIAMGIYGTVSLCLTVTTSKFPRLRKRIDGTPTILMDNGKLYRKNFKKAKLDLSEFMVMCRQLGYFNLEDIQTAVFEYNGKLTVLPVSRKRPATPADMELSPDQELLAAEIIMDGRVMGENLKRMGLDSQWLFKQLAERGYGSPGEIYLGLCDANQKLTLFENQE